MLTLYGVGNIVGAGVYVLVGKIAEPAGYLSILAFLVAALVAFCAALSYAELAARFPVSAGVSVYLHEAFKAVRLSTVLGLFLVVAGAVSTATLLKGFTGYFHTLVDIPLPIITITAAVILTAVALRGIKESVGLAGLLTVIEVGGLLFLVGSILLAKPDTLGAFNHDFSQAIGSIDGAAIAGVFSAALIAFYAFIGFEDMVNIAEEVKEPQKAFPKAILFSVSLVTILYIAVAAVALGVLTPDALGNSSAPLADAYHAATGNSVGVIVVVSLLATLNGILVNIIMGSRYLYGLGKRGWISPWFSKVSGRHVPARGIILVAGLALLCALWIPIEKLAQTTSLLLLVVFFAVNISLIVIKRRQSIAAGTIRVTPTFIPWIGSVAALGLLLAQIATLIH
jgi:amino acid transporter